MDSDETANESISEDDIASNTSNYAICIKSEDWDRIKPMKRPHTRLKLEKGWTDLFSDLIATKNQSCVITYKRNKVKSDHSRCVHAPFFNGLGYCKFEDCASFQFTIDDEPDSGEDVEVKVTETGKIPHQHGEVQRRFVTGQKRQQIATEVKEKGPSSVYYERLGNIPEEAFDEGNRTDVPSIAVLQKISSQLKSEDKLDDDILKECIVAKDIWYHEDESGGKVKGYIQGISAFPFHLLMFSSDQIRLFIQNENKTLHFDATGSVVKRIPGQEKKVLYYALVMPSDEKGNPPIPVMEFISNDHTVPSITYALSKFKHAVTQVSNKIINPIRIEVDYSWALILSICHVFNYLNVRAFLRRAWNISRSVQLDQALTELCIIHVCSAHMIKCIIHGLKKMNVKGKQMENAVRWFALLQNSTTLNEAAAIFEDVCVVLTSKYETETYNFHAKSLNDKTKGIEMSLPEDEPSDSEEAQVESIDEQNYLLTDGIRNQSPFTSFFDGIKTKVENVDDGEEGVDKETGLTKNEMYNPDALKAINKHMAMFPFWSGLLLGEQEEISRATNSEVENWFRIVKYDILSKRRYLRPGEFAMVLHRGLKGRVREFSSVANGIWNERRKKKRETKNKKNECLSEEKWSKSGKKRRAPKYFTSSRKTSSKGARTSLFVGDITSKTDTSKSYVETVHVSRQSVTVGSKIDETLKSADNENDNFSHQSHGFAGQNMEATSEVDDIETFHHSKPLRSQTSPVFKRKVSKSAPKTHKAFGKSEARAVSPKKTHDGPVNDEQHFRQWQSYLKWGGSVTYKNRTVKMVNTCTVDNFLMIFHCILAQKQDIVLWMSQNSSNRKVLETLLSIHLLFRSGRWSEGKALWLQQCGFTYQEPLWNAYGTESEMFVDLFAELQRSFRSSACSDKRCPDSENLVESKDIFLSDIENVPNEDILERSFTQWTAGYTSVCRRKKRRNKFCKGTRTFTARQFYGTAPEVLIVDMSLLARVRNLQITDIDRSLTIQDKSYALFAVTICRRSHFIAKVKYAGSWFEYDGLSDDIKAGTIFQGTMNFAVFVSC